jgi:hypothetical protein
MSQDEMRIRLAGIAGWFACILPALRTTARELGWAIALHGSMQRDMDLVAVPWVDEAAAPEVLVERLRNLLGGHIPNHAIEEWDRANRNPVDKPHGRKAWSIQLGGGAYIDLSIMPRVPAK